jgi:hypothetical protein
LWRDSSSRKILTETRRCSPSLISVTQGLRFKLRPARTGGGAAGYRSWWRGIARGSSGERSRHSVPPPRPAFRSRAPA